MTNKKLITNKDYTLFGFKLKSEMQEVYVTEFFRFLGLAMVEVFLPIYIFQNHHLEIKAVFLFYGVCMIIGIASSLLAGEISSRYGLRITMALGILIHIPFFISMAYLGEYDLMIWISAILNGMRQGIWFTSRNTDITLYTSHSKKTGADMANFRIIYMIVLIVSPLLGGYAISKFGYNYLYGLAIAFSLVSLAFSLLLGERYYKQTFPSLKILTESIKDLKRNSLSKIYLLQGIKSFVILGVWPLILFDIIPDLESIGWLSTLTMLTLTVMAIKISSSIDHHPEKSPKYIKRGAILEGIAWIAQAGAFNFSTLFLSDTARKVSNEYIENSSTIIAFGKRNKDSNTLINMTKREVTIYIGFVLSSMSFLIFSFFLSDTHTLRIGMIAVGIISILLGLTLKDVK